MPVQQVTVWPTEADFETDLQAALRRAFPWLPHGSIRHQTKFSFKWGHATIEVDGRRQSQVTARSDILLYAGPEPLAVLELKRPGNPIVAADIEQGLSYARMLHPRPPLVAVTNGSDLSLLETHTGKEWTPSEQSEAEFANLLKSATEVASEDLKRAVSTLMGSNPGIWVQAIRQTSSVTIAELSGSWADQLQPFVPDFLIPRKATAAILSLLRQGQRFILIEGPPLSGKSNVLRELTVKTASAEDLVVLFVEADSGAGVFQAIADTLANALSWPVSRNEARDWLLRLSKGAGPSLVIAVDGLGIGQDDIPNDVHDLASHLFGSRVRVVLALDDSVADRIVMDSTGRKKSAIGRRSHRIRLDVLDDDEFKQTVQMLWDRRIAIMKGGESSPELRISWILRAVVSQIVSEERYANEKLIAALQPLLGLDIIEHARERFCDDELRRMLRATAEAVLQDAGDRTRPIGLILASMATYAVRRKTLLHFLEHAEVETLVARGFLRPMLHGSGEAVLVIRLPELVASEAADVLGLELATKVKADSKAAAEWLATTASNIPLGDIVAAQAVIDAAYRHGSLPLSLITALIQSPPEKRVIAPGTRAAMYLPGVGMMDMTFQGDGSIVLHAHGQSHKIQAEPGDEQPTSYGNVHSWLILSHFGGRPFAIEQEGEPGPRVDPMVLLEVGTCPIVLRAVGPDLEMSAVSTHLVSGAEVVCEKAGIVEPITLSILRFLRAAGPQAEDWIEEAVERNSLPLLMRLHIALQQLADSADREIATFAQRILIDLVNPVLSQSNLLH